MHGPLRGCVALLAAGFFAAGVRADDWTRLGADAGMTRYSADDIAGPVQLDYVKRFYSTFSNDPAPGNYYYAQSIQIRGGTAAVFSSDTPPHIPGDKYGQGLPLTLFNFDTGQTTARVTTPSIADWSNQPLVPGVPYTYPSGRYSLHLGEVSAEIDSGHYTQSVLWGSDGNLYVRHGGDNAVTASYNPVTHAWTRLTELKASPDAGFNYNSAFEGDANAFIQSYAGELIYRPGDTRQTSPYVATDVSAAAYAAGSAGAWKADLGPNISASPAGDYYSGLRYGDIPKVATVNLNGAPTGVAVVSGLVVTRAAALMQYAVQTQATNLFTGRPIWTATFASDSGGPGGFYTSTPDYWRFLASADGTYVMFSGAASRTLEGLDMATGHIKWTYTVPAGTTAPLLAAHGSDLYVIGDGTQLKMNVDTGSVAWTTSRSTQAEATSFMSFEDPVIHPLVLTSDTAWYVDGSNSTPGDQMLVGISTATGQVLQQIDLTALVAARAGQSLLCVNDMAAADGRLGVLLGIRSTTDPYPVGAPGTSNGIIYQDLYTFSAVPDPGGVASWGAAAMVLLCCGRRRSQTP